MARQGNLPFVALADPTRRAILQFLAREGESPAGVIADAVKTVSRTAVSTHLAVLRAAGLVNERRQGRYRLYAVQPRAADEVLEFLATLYGTSPSDLRQERG